MFELVRDRGEALRLCRSARFPPLPLAQLLVLGQALQRGRRQLRLLEHARRSGEAVPAAAASRAGASSPSGPDDDGGLGEHGGACFGPPERTWTRSRSASGIPGLVESGFVRRSTASQPGSSRSERSAARATGNEPEWSELDRDELALRARPEELGVDAWRETIR